MHNPCRGWPIPLPVVGRRRKRRTRPEKCLKLSSPQNHLLSLAGSSQVACLPTILETAASRSPSCRGSRKPQEVPGVEKLTIFSSSRGRQRRRCDQHAWLLGFHCMTMAEVVCTSMAYDWPQGWANQPLLHPSQPTCWLVGATWGCMLEEPHHMAGWRPEEHLDGLTARSSKRYPNHHTRLVIPQRT